MSAFGEMPVKYVLLHQGMILPGLHVALYSKNPTVRNIRAVERSIIRKPAALAAVQGFFTNLTSEVWENWACSPSAALYHCPGPGLG